MYTYCFTHLNDTEKIHRLTENELIVRQESVRTSLGHVSIRVTCPG